MAIIKKVEQRFGGHVKLEFEDGSATLVTRGTEGLSTLKPGDSWPPVAVVNGIPLAGETIADDQKLAADLKDAEPSAS